MVTYRQADTEFLRHAQATAFPKNRIGMAARRCVLIFSTIPKTGTLTLRNISQVLLTSANAKSCGVVTITAPLTGSLA